MEGTGNAAALYQRSVEVRENDGMIDNIELAESLERLASAYEALGRRDEAAPLFQRSLSIREQVYGADDPGLAKSLHGLAVIQHENGNYREAEELYERALDLIERDKGLKDLFAAQVLTNITQLGIPEDKVNIAGGAIAIGHPIGGSGVRVLTTLLHQMKRTNAKRGIASLCLGGGNAVSMLVERV